KNFEPQRERITGGFRLRFRFLTLDLAKEVCVMEVILLEKVRNLGALGDKVNVRSGYGRNFLIPQRKAVPATEANVQHFEEKRAEFEAKANQSLAAAEARMEQLQ